MNSPSTRVIAFYLPQFHPIPENDEWWGKGFTEWTNTAKAKPLFRGHYQPHVPADLGFYDLRVPETRIAQAQLARKHGIAAFCYYHYWFAGKRILDRPFNEVLASGQPNFPFCLCWANQTWTGIWHGAPDRVLIEQTYPGLEDHRRHFETLLPALTDRRYLTIDGKPMFVVYNPMRLPDSRPMTDLWRELAAKAGLPGLFLVAERDQSDWNPRPLGFDAVVCVRLPPRRRPWVPWRQPVEKLKGKLQDWLGKPTIHEYDQVVDSLVQDAVPGIESFPCVIPNWDNTPRSGANGLVLNGSTPDGFRRHVNKVLNRMRNVPREHRIVFVKSWNEWAEGNHLEPDLKFRLGYLEALYDELKAADALGVQGR
jgi:hypothetical protein